MTQREQHRSLYLSYLEHCDKHDLDRMASFYTSTIKVNEVPMDPAAVAAQFAPLFSAFPDWHWEIRNLVVDGDYIAVHFTVTGTHRGVFQGIEATSRRVTISEFTFYRLEDDKFTEVGEGGDFAGENGLNPFGEAFALKPHWAAVYMIESAAARECPWGRTRSRVHNTHHRAWWRLQTNAAPDC